MNAKLPFAVYYYRRRRRRPVRPPLFLAFIRSLRHSCLLAAHDFTVTNSFARSILRATFSSSDERVGIRSAESVSVSLRTVISRLVLVTQLRYPFSLRNFSDCDCKLQELYIEITLTAVSNKLIFYIFDMIPILDI